MQSGELLVDCMKLQNILNFEVQKLLKQINTPFPTTNSNTNNNQVLFKDNLNVDSQEQLYHDTKNNIEVNVLAQNKKIDTSSMNNQRNRANGTVLSMSGIRDRTTTDLGLHPNDAYPGALSDGTPKNQGVGQSPTLVDKN